MVLPTNPQLSEEGLSLAIIESLSVGVPVIATDSGGNKEAVEDGKSGMMVWDRESYVLELGEKMNSISSNPELYKVLSAGATEKWNRDHTYSKMTSSFLNILERTGFLKKVS